MKNKKAFEKRQQLRKHKREIHQRLMHKIMSKVGGYNSYAWHMFLNKISRKINKRLAAAAEARKKKEEAKKKAQEQK